MKITTFAFMLTRSFYFFLNHFLLIVIGNFLSSNISVHVKFIQKYYTIFVTEKFVILGHINLYEDIANCAIMHLLIVHFIHYKFFTLQKTIKNSNQYQLDSFNRLSYKTLVTLNIVHSAIKYL